MVMRLFLTLMLPFWVQLCHSVTVGVDQASCVAAGRFRPLNSAWLETKLIAEAAASKTAAVAAAGVADKVANGIEVDDELFRVYMIMGTFFGGPLPQPSVQAIASQ
jgi:hypothetical protein